MHSRQLPRTSLITLTVLLVLFVVITIVLVRPVYVSERGQTEGFVVPSELEEHVRILSVDFSPRSYTNMENLNASALYIEEQLRQYIG